MSFSSLLRALMHLMPPLGKERFLYFMLTCWVCLATCWQLPRSCEWRVTMVLHPVTAVRSQDFIFQTHAPLLTCHNPEWIVSHDWLTCIYNLHAGETSSPAWKSTWIPPKQSSPQSDPVTEGLSPSGWVQVWLFIRAWRKQFWQYFQAKHSVTRIPSFFHASILAPPSFILLPVIAWLWSHSFQFFSTTFSTFPSFFIISTTIPCHDTPSTATPSHVACFSANHDLRNARTQLWTHTTSPHCILLSGRPLGLRILSTRCANVAGHTIHPSCPLGHTSHFSPTPTTSLLCHLVPHCCGTTSMHRSCTCITMLWLQNTTSLPSGY